MSNPYVQVSLTYLRHSLFSRQRWMVILVALSWFMVMYYFVCQPVRASTVTFLLCIIYMPSLGFLQHLKEQVTNVQASFVPNYRRVHALVALGMVGFFTILLPIALALLVKVHPVCLVVCFWGTFCVVFWGSMVSQWLMSVFVVVVFIAMGTHEGSETIKRFLLGENLFLAYGLLGFCAATTFWCGYRLYHATEEMPVWRKIQKFGVTAESNRIANFREKGTWWNEKIADWDVARTSRHILRSPHSFWSRVCRWQLGGSHLMTRLALFVPGVFGVSWFSSGFRAIEGFGILYFGLIPSAFAAQYFVRYHKERLVWLPINRLSYLRQWTLALFLLQLKFWAIGWLTVLPFFVLSYFWTNTWELSPYVILVTFLVQFPSFGLIFWLARYRSPRLMSGGLIFMSLCLNILMAMVMTRSEPGKVLFVAGLFAVVGIVVTFDGYRRWLNADWD